MLARLQPFTALPHLSSLLPLPSEDRLQRVMPAEILESENELQVSLDMPGHDPATLQVRIEGSTLTVQSERRAEQTRGSLWRERSYGQFSRSFELPPWVDGVRAEARFTHGVLTVTVPKREDAKPRSIQVKVERSETA